MDLPRALEVPLTKGDRTIIRYVMDRWDLDVLLVGVVEPFDVLSRLRIVEYRSDGSVSNVHEALSANDSIPSMVPQAIATTMDYFSPRPLGIVQLSNVVPGLAIDGVPFDRYLVKESGTYYLTVTAPGYDVQKLPVAVESSQVTTAVVELKQQVGNPLLVTSESGLSFITIEHVVEQQVPFVWLSRKTPFSLHAEEPGFIPLDLMYDDVGKEIVLEFQPLWMNPVFGTKRMQDEVYASLGRTLVATALGIGYHGNRQCSEPWVPLRYRHSTRCPDCLHITKKRSIVHGNGTTRCNNDEEDFRRTFEGAFRYTNDR